MESTRPGDFTGREEFPGHRGNRFDTLMRLVETVTLLSLPLFAIVLFAVALLITRGDPARAVLLWSFFAVDWGMLALLPRAGKSFGPPQPPTFMLSLMRLPFAWLPDPWFVITELIGTALVFYGFWIEPHALQVTRQTLRSSRLKFKQPLRVVHLGDIHVERLTGREAQILRLVDELAPDLILFSGDILNLSYTHDPVAHAHGRRVLAGLAAPLGVFAVSGSPGVDPPDVMNDVLQGIDNVRWLRDQAVTLSHDGQAFDLIGINCTHKPFLDAPRLRSALTGEPERFRILLYHTPDLAPEAAEAGIDLQLSGHTHGGQVRLPFFGALYAASLYGKRFEVGRYQLGRLTLYVTRGVGLEGGGAPRVRFNCPPEIVLWEIGGGTT